eukprot:358692-Chlamydomonas_euryale.AAC.3
MPPGGRGTCAVSEGGATVRRAAAAPTGGSLGAMPVAAHLSRASIGALGPPTPVHALPEATPASGDSGSHTSILRDLAQSTRAVPTPAASKP